MRLVFAAFAAIVFLIFLLPVFAAADEVQPNSCLVEGNAVSIETLSPSVLRVVFDSTLARNDSAAPCFFQANEEIAAIYDQRGYQAQRAPMDLREGDAFAARLYSSGEEDNQTNFLDAVEIKNPSCAPLENCGLDCGEAGFSKDSRGCYECVCATLPAPVVASEQFFRFSFASGWNSFSFPLAVQRSVFCVPGKECLQQMSFLPRIIATDCESQSVLWGWIDGGRAYSEFQLPDLGKKELVSFAGELLKGYWIKAKTPCSATIAGDEVAVQLLDGKQLFKGWNLVGAPLLATDFASVKGDCVVEKGPYAWDASAQKFVKAPQLEPGKTVFVKVSRDCWLSVQG